MINRILNMMVLVGASFLLILLASMIVFMISCIMTIMTMFI